MDIDSILNHVRHHIHEPWSEQQLLDVVLYALQVGREGEAMELLRSHCSAGVLTSVAVDKIYHSAVVDPAPDGGLRFGRNLLRWAVGSPDIDFHWISQARAYGFFAQPYEIECLMTDLVDDAGCNKSLSFLTLMVNEWQNTLPGATLKPNQLSYMIALNKTQSLNHLIAHVDFEDNCSDALEMCLNCENIHLFQELVMRIPSHNLVWTMMMTAWMDDSQVSRQAIDILWEHMTTEDLLEAKKAYDKSIKDEPPEDNYFARRVEAWQTKEALQTVVPTPELGRRRVM